MQITKISLATALLCLTTAAFAQTAAPAAPAAPAAAKAPEPDYTLSYNIGATTDYRYRGISQSRLKPALQGGADLSLKSGVYVGVWASSISWIKDAGAPTLANVDTGTSPVEIDLYGGYKGSAGPVSYDVGMLQYLYPGNKYKAITGAANANTLEAYGAITVGPVTAKYSHALSNLFGFRTLTDNSKGSGYLDLTANFDLGDGWSIAPHVGHQKVKNFKDASYTDYAFTVNKDIDGLVLSAAVIGTNAKKDIGGSALAYPSPANKNLGRNGLVLSIKKNF